jgi:hypothetical protein
MSTNKPVEELVHDVTLEIEPVSTEVPIATPLRLTIRAVCRDGCQLARPAIEILDGEEILPSSFVERPVNPYEPPPDDPVDEPPMIVVRAPSTVGTHAWRVRFPRQAVNGIAHAETTAALEFETTPLPTSLAVWGISGPVVAGRPFAFKAGAKSLGDRPLTGAELEVVDESGARIGSGCLGEHPWEGTSALYWTEIQAVAPASEGEVNWSVRFAAREADLPHTPSLAVLTFLTVRPPDHTLTITVVDKDTAAPIPHAHVRMGIYRAETDENGFAMLSVPAGTYDLKTWITAHETTPETLDVTTNMSLRLEAVAIPEEDPAARWM